MTLTPDDRQACRASFDAMIERRARLATELADIEAGLAAFGRLIEQDVPPLPVRVASLGRPSDQLAPDGHGQVLAAIRAGHAEGLGAIWARCDGLSRERVAALVAELIDAGVVRRSGRGSGTRYRLARATSSGYSVRSQEL